MGKLYQIKLKKIKLIWTEFNLNELNEIWLNWNIGNKIKLNESNYMDYNKLY